MGIISDQPEVIYTREPPSVYHWLGSKAPILVIGSGGKTESGSNKLTKKREKDSDATNELAVDTDINRLKAHDDHIIYGTFMCSGKTGQTRHIKNEIEEYLKDMGQQNKSAYIYYTGHGDSDGDWLFYDGYISLDWLYQTHRKYGRGPICIHSDCCHSGKWVEECIKKTKNGTFGVRVDIHASASCHGYAYDNQYSKRWLKRSNKLREFNQNMKRYGAIETISGGEASTPHVIN